MVTDVVISTAVFYIIQAFSNDNSQLFDNGNFKLFFLKIVLTVLTKALVFQIDFRIITITAHMDGDLTCTVNHGCSVL